MNKCTICSSQFDSCVVTKEMMFGFRDKFGYNHCSECGCVQISVVPPDLSKYYSTDYYSYSVSKKTTIRNKIKNYLLPLSMNYRMGLTNSILSFIANFRYKNIFTWLNASVGVYRNLAVLDIGCGTGSLLSYFHKCGFNNLTGIDLFIKSEVNKEQFRVYKNDVFKMVEKFDLIMLHHSFEHMENPDEVFKKLHSILNDNGMLIIRIPLSDSYAWRKYKTDWFAFDAPRHLYLHTVKSISILSEKFGFYIENIFYDSTWQQFYFSESYQRNIAMNEKFEEFSKSDIKQFQHQAEILNKLRDGDQACFYIRKNNNKSCSN